ncbi:hypothetical protein VULLAG_LOCUS822 [Vulpes lagopus]
MRSLCLRRVTSSDLSLQRALRNLPPDYLGLVSGNYPLVIVISCRAVELLVIKICRDTVEGSVIPGAA